MWMRLNYILSFSNPHHTTRCERLVSYAAIFVLKWNICKSSPSLTEGSIVNVCTPHSCYPIDIYIRKSVIKFESSDAFLLLPLEDSTAVRILLLLFDFHLK